MVKIKKIGTLLLTILGVTGLLFSICAPMMFCIWQGMQLKPNPSGATSGLFLFMFVPLFLIAVAFLGVIAAGSFFILIAGATLIKRTLTKKEAGEEGPSFGINFKKLDYVLLIVIIPILLIIATLGVMSGQVFGLILLFIAGELPVVYFLPNSMKLLKYIFEALRIQS